MKKVYIAPEIMEYPIKIEACLAQQSLNYNSSTKTSSLLNDPTNLEEEIDAD